MMLPLRYLGEGQFETPRGFSKRCDKELVVGEVLGWERTNDRSKRSHDHFFAQLEDLWRNLPEHIADEFPSADHLRKFALIKSGHCTMARIVCATNKEAIFACSLFQSMDGFAVCEVAARVVTVWRAKSQSYKAMGKTLFQKSKDDVFRVISEIIGTDASQAGMAA